MARDRFEEKLAAAILKDIGFISKSFKVADKPDIVCENIGIEVTIKSNSPVSAKALFGDRKGIKNFDLSEYRCCVCEHLDKCKSESAYGDFIRCFKQSYSGLINADNVIIGDSTLFYNRTDYPIMIPNSVELIDLKCEKELQNIISSKELKSKHYMNLCELNLFIFYERDIPSTLNIESKAFKNIFIYSIPNGKLCKNFKITKHYIGGISEETFNSLISNTFDES